MKLASFLRPDGSEGWGVVTKDGIVDLTAEYPSLRIALEKDFPFAAHVSGRPTIPTEAVTWLPPVPDPRKIICIGLNYRSHVLEGSRPAPEKPVIFTRFAQSQTGHEQPIVRPRESEQLDYEGELAIVIGKAGRRIAPENVWDHIFGYSCYNDASIRDWQKHTHQWTPGKNFPRTGAFGPWLVTSDEMGDATKATLVTRLNGMEVQRTIIDELLFGIPTIISYCSIFTELSPGDVIATGTTGGVGQARDPKLWMKPGDTVEVEISGIGTLRNTIEQES